MHISKAFDYSLSLIKSIIFNFKYFEFQTALKFPVFISWKTHVNCCEKGRIKFLCPIQTGILKLGFGGTDAIIEERKNFLSLEKGSVLEIGGRTTIAPGFSIQNKGYMKISGGFINKNSRLFCANRIIIGSDFLSGWNIELRDMNGHKTGKAGMPPIDNIRGIKIGDHVWIAANACVLPGAEIASGSVLAFRSMLTKPCKEENVLLAGEPAEVKTRGIVWKH